MGVMDKFLNYMKLNGEEDDEYFDEDYLDDEEELEPAPSSRRAQKMKEEEEPEERLPRKQPSSSKITPIKQPTSRRMQNSAVVLNLEGLDVDIAQRIIDFTSGSCFAIAGNLQKISHYIFIITPASVDISGDFQDIFGSSFEMPLNT